MTTDAIPLTLTAARAALARALHWPHNVGVEIRILRPHASGPVPATATGSERLPARPAAPESPPAAVLVAYIHGLTDADRLQRWVLEPLRQTATITAPRLYRTRRLSTAVSAVLGGAAALIWPGTGRAVLVETRIPTCPQQGPTLPAHQMVDNFGPDVLTNVTLIRRRLRDPTLVARPATPARGRVATAVVVYMRGRAAPGVVRRVHGWVRRHAGEEAMRRGLAAGLSGWFGLLPDLATTRWPDKVAALLDVGYVAVFLDRLPYAYVVPVTAPALLYGPGDTALRRPLGAVLRALRLSLCSLVVLAPATVVALMNYHQEMMPTPFLLALASVRENAPFPIVAEVLALQVALELIREGTERLPLRIGPGAALSGGLIFLLLLVFTGLVGPLPALVTALVSFAMLALPSHDLAYMVAAWRFWAIGGAAIFGFYGLAAVLFLLLAYLSQAESFGVPFGGETGTRFTGPGRVSSRRRPLRRAKGTAWEGG